MTTLNLRYQQVEKPKPESAINENEIRITTQGSIRNYITYATSLLQLMPILEALYNAPRRTTNQIYMLLIILFILSQDSSFNASIHKLNKEIPFGVFTCLSWFARELLWMMQ